MTRAAVGAPAAGHASTGTKLAAAVPWTVVTRVTTLAATVAVSALTYRTLGKESYGLFSLLRQTALYFVLFASFGLDQSLLRFVPLLRQVGRPGDDRRLVGRTLGMQAVLLVVFWVALILFAEPLAGVLNLESAGIPLETLRVLLVATGGLGAAMVLFQSLQNATIATFRTRAVSIASLARGLVWCGGVAAALAAGAAIAPLLVVEALAYATAGVVLGGIALRAFAPANNATPATSGHPDVARTVTLGRQLRYSAVIVGSGLVNLVVQRQSEAFFLSRYHGLDLAAHYDLVYQYPQLALEFIPLAVAPLVVSAFSELHALDPEALHRAMRRYYRALILLLVPLAFLGACWADRLLVLLFGQDIAADALWANVFSVLLAVPSVYLPLSAALLTLERAHLMLPFGYLQVAINLGLDVLFIPRFGLLGAVMAVAGTMAVAVPLMLGIGARITRGLAFPGRELARTVVACSPALLALPLRWILPGAFGTALGITLAVVLLGWSLWRGPLLGAEERVLLRGLLRRERGQGDRAAD